MMGSRKTKKKEIYIEIGIKNKQETEKTRDRIEQEIEALQKHPSVKPPPPPPKIYTLDRELLEIELTKLKGAEVRAGVSNFLKNFYTSTNPKIEDVKKITPILKDKAIDNMTQTFCEGLIERKEIKQALKQFNNNRSPGHDGFPKEFYVHFWKELKYHLEKLHLHIFFTGSINENPKNSKNIKLLYKKKYS